MPSHSTSVEARGSSTVARRAAPRPRRPGPSGRRAGRRPVRRCTPAAPGGSVRVIAGQRRFDGGPRRPAARRPGSARRRCRRWWRSRRSRSSPGSACARRRWYSTSRVARPRNTGSTPAAKGSSVPPWPTRRVDDRRRTRPTTSCDVGPEGLATTSTPSSPPARGRAGSWIAGSGLTGGPRPPAARRPRAPGRIASSSGASMVAPAARAWPPPPERAGQDRRVDAARPGPDAQARGPVRLLLEQHRDLGGLRLGEQVDDPLRVRRQGARRVEVRPAQRGPHAPVRSGEVRRRSSTRPNSRSWASGLVRYSRREMSDSGAPASTSAADTASVRGVAFGWANVAVSMTMPAISTRGQRPIARHRAGSRAGRRAAPPARTSRRPPGRSSRPSPTASFDAWWSMIDPGQRREQRRVARGHVARPGPASRSRTGPAGRRARRVGDRSGPGRRPA